MMNDFFCIFNARILDENVNENGAILCENGKIYSIFKGNFPTIELIQQELSKNLENLDKIKIDFFDANNLVVMPAFIDMHVHFRDPGFTQKEDLRTGLMAAINGGYGTVVTMPNTNPVISSLEQAEEVCKRAEKMPFSNLIQSVSITKDFNGQDVSHLNDLQKEKVPLITEDGHDVDNPKVMSEGMKIAAKKQIIVSCHCEDRKKSQKAKIHRAKALKLLAIENRSQKEEQILHRELIKANILLADAEDVATKRNIKIAKKANCHIHLCHVSTKKSIEYVRKAKNHFDVTAEVTPHHIALNIDDEKNLLGFVNPPIRSKTDQNAIIQAICDGTVDVIATDHAPHTEQDKKNGAPGFVGLETAFAVCHTTLVKNGFITIQKLSSLMSASPARILGLKKGLIKKDYDADFVVINPEEKWQVKGKNFFSKGKITLFEDKILTGRVKTVFVAGKKCSVE